MLNPAGTGFGSSGVGRRSCSRAASRYSRAAEAPVPGSKAGDIIEVMGSGFMLHDRLLRPAKVGVSSTPSS